MYIMQSSYKAPVIHYTLLHTVGLNATILVLGLKPEKKQS